jgi:tRNA(Ile)-lysidine synthetase, N-terminal domain
MDAWEKFKKNIEAAGLVQPGDRVIAAVSGGPDSTCLLHLLWRLKKTMPIELFAVTMDHGLRKQAAREISIVERFGKKLGIPVISRRIPVRQYAETHSLSLETAGRTLRYRTLAAVAEEFSANKIATGHTADDNAETVIMWLIRGTGSDGLAGIPPCREGEKGMRVIRPILPVTRAEVMEYVKGQKIPYSVDRSNFQLDFTRNRIRHGVIPMLKKYNPCLVQHLYNLSRLVAADNAFLNEITAGAIQRAVRRVKNAIYVDLKLFFRYNTVVQSRVLKRSCRKTFPGAY